MVEHLLHLADAPALDEHDHAIARLESLLARGEHQPSFAHYHADHARGGRKLRQWPAGEAALGPHRDVEDLEAVLVEHRDLTRPRVMGKAHHHFRGLGCWVDGRIDPGGVEHLAGAPFAENRHCEAGAVNLRENGCVETVGVGAQREHRGGGAANVLAAKEIAIKRGGLEHACPIKRVGELSRPLGVALDQTHANPSIEQDTSDRRPQTR